MKNKYILLLFICIIGNIFSAPNEDFVKPNQYYNYNKSATYSGYLKVSETKELHYVLVLSQTNSESDPLVLWLSGGPGCSSLYAYTSENGPLVFKSFQVDLEQNPYSWNLEANMLYIESPIGVGFSNGLPEDIKTLNDDITAKDNLTALKAFFEKFPEYKKNDFYISGESYAGVYIPHLTNKVIDFNLKATESEKINLKGMIVGNGVTHPVYDDTYSAIEFAYGHNLISVEEKLNFTKICGTKAPYPDTEECNNLIFSILNKLWDLNLYDIYRPCGPIKPKPPKDVNDISLSHPIKRFWKVKVSTNNSMSFLSDATEDDEFPVCSDISGIQKLFNTEEVQEQFHVTKKKFNMCSDEVGNNYTSDPQLSYYLYPKIINNKIRILKYSGDTDMAVPFTGTRKWISELKLRILKAYQPWHAYNTRELSGYVVKYKGLTFVTISGVGHLVPQWKRKNALYMFNKFLKDEDL